MSGKLFSFTTLKNVGREQYSEGDQMARQLCIDTIDGIKEHRLEALELVNSGQTDESLTDDERKVWEARKAQITEGYTVIDALLHGRHREAVLPLVLEAFPEIWAKPEVKH